MSTLGRLSSRDRRGHPSDFVSRLRVIPEGTGLSTDLTQLAMVVFALFRRERRALTLEQRSGELIESRDTVGVTAIRERSSLTSVGRFGVPQSTIRLSAVDRPRGR